MRWRWSCFAKQSCLLQGNNWQDRLSKRWLQRHLVIHFRPPSSPALLLRVPVIHHTTHMLDSNCFDGSPSANNSCLGKVCEVLWVCIRWCAYLVNVLGGFVVSHHLNFVLVRDRMALWVPICLHAFKCPSGLSGDPFCSGYKFYVALRLLLSWHASRAMNRCRETGRTINGRWHRSLFVLYKLPGVHERALTREVFTALHFMGMT